MLSDVGGGGRGSECSERPVFIFSVKEIWIFLTTRHHVEH